MAKSNSKIPDSSPATFSGKAVTMRKEPDGVLAVAVEFEIVDGVIVSERNLNAPDLPASAAGQGTRSLWRMFQG